MIDGGADLDIEAAIQNIGEADVVCLYFPTLDRTLLVDTRCSDETAQFVRVVPMAANSADRLRSLQELRPQLPRPRSITLIPWVRRVDSLCSAGVWEAVLDRLDACDQAAVCLEILRGLEERETQRAITGREYRTLWARAGV